MFFYHFILISHNDYVYLFIYSMCLFKSPGVVHDNQDQEGKFSYATGLQVCMSCLVMYVLSCMSCTVCMYVMYECMYIC